MLPLLTCCVLPLVRATPTAARVCVCCDLLALPLDRSWGRGGKVRGGNHDDFWMIQESGRGRVGWPAVGEWRRGWVSRAAIWGENEFGTSRKPNQDG